MSAATSAQSLLSFLFSSILNPIPWFSSENFDSTTSTAISARSRVLGTQELVDLICRHSERDDIFALSLVNKSFSAGTIIPIYQHIRFRGFDQLAWLANSQYAWAVKSISNTDIALFYQPTEAPNTEDILRSLFNLDSFDLMARSFERERHKRFRTTELIAELLVAARKRNRPSTHKFALGFNTFAQLRDLRSTITARGLDFISVFSHVTELRLTEESFFPPLGERVEDSQDMSFIQNAIDSCAHHLRVLRLEVFEEVPLQFGQHFRKLERLRLWQLKIPSADRFIEALQCSTATLRDAWFFEVSLESGKWSEIMQFLVRCHKLNSAHMSGIFYTADFPDHDAYRSAMRAADFDEFRLFDRVQSNRADDLHAYRDLSVTVNWDRHWHHSPAEAPSVQRDWVVHLLSFEDFEKSGRTRRWSDPRMVEHERLIQNVCPVPGGMFI